MLLEYPTENRSDLFPLFANHTRLSAIINAILNEGWGEVLVDSVENPEVALLSYQRSNFLAGNSKSVNATKILSSISRHQIFVAPDDEWTELVKKYWGFRLVSLPRTKFSSNNLNLDHIRKFKDNLAAKFAVEEISTDNLDKFQEKLVEDASYLFGSPENFLKMGFGFCIKDKDEDQVVCLAATGNPPYDNSFEIQVITANSPDYRRKGLATAACAHLIEYSLENNLDPRWDAGDDRSRNLALKLGYTNPEPYEIFLHTRFVFKLLKKAKMLRILRLFIRN